MQLGPVHVPLLISGRAEPALYVSLPAGAIATKAAREALRGHVSAAQQYWRRAVVYRTFDVMSVMA